MSNVLDTLLTRREAFKVGASLVSAYWFLPLVAPTNVHAQSKVSPRGSARFVIFVMLEGGQSHVDSWDLKEGKWTPQNFDIREIAPGVKWPMALFPQLAKQRERYSLIRSMEAWDSVHFRAQYYVQSGHMMNPALQKELPPIGTVVAYESAARRQTTDTLPGYVAVNVTQSQAGLLGCGFLPATYTPFHIDTTSGIGAISLDDEARKTLRRRWELLKKVDERLRNDSSLAAKAYRDYHNHYEGAVSMMSDQRASQVFQIDAADHDRYGKSQVGDGCILARNLVEADAGTHFVLVNHRDWDHHNRIYAEGNHYKLCREIDTALTSLFDDLAARKRADGRTLLDETMVVCFGEFGRTPGELSAANGRDHYQYALTGLFAGGGVQGGRVIGKTDELGAKVVAPDWNGKRSVYMEDVATTIYSALGIDWSKVIEGAPSGRAFHYIEPFASKQMIKNQEITNLFA
ncbi:MAG TPA: DUF1501 domain-containing protein [Vicinamibacterales bacterium]|nr:DUF1501 domain-containing protein [Vicinamibacterales bacterium]